MTKSTTSVDLFTVGHSSRSIDEFLQMLREHDINLVGDVRSSPYSRRFPHFSQPALIEALRESFIGYWFLGNELGARRIEPECYENGVASYDRIASTPAFISGMEMLHASLASKRIAVLCAEKDPVTCHRMILVCRQVQREGKGDIGEGKGDIVL